MCEHFTRVLIALSLQQQNFNRTINAEVLIQSAKIQTITTTTIILLLQLLLYYYYYYYFCKNLNTYSMMFKLKKIEVIYYT